MDDDDVGHNDLKLRPEFDRGEAEAALASLSLATLGSDGHWLVVMRDSFDVRVSGEPYHALMLLGSAKQSHLPYQFPFQCCNLPQLYRVIHLP